MPDTNRREFLERAGLWIAGAAVAGRHDFPSPEPTATGAPPAESHPQGRSLGVALVGLGGLSTGQLAPALQKTTRCHLAGIVTGTPAKIPRWKAQYNIPDNCIYNYDTMERMADNPAIDIVYVVTPNALHATHTLRALKARKHVLCEKPMEVSVERCDQMIAAAKAAGKQLAIGYRCRFDPFHRALAQLAREQTLGQAKLIEAGFCGVKGNTPEWRLDHALAGGGPLMDLGIYALQSARMITGEEPTAVAAFTTVTDHQRFKTVEESILFQYSFPSGIMAQCRASYNANGNRVSVMTTRGTFGLEPAYNYSGIRGFRSDRQPLQFTEIDQFAAELDDFADCVATGRPTAVPGEEGRRDVKILMATYEAARSGRVVRLDGP